MKTQISILFTGLGLLLAACSSSPSASGDFIPGNYVNHAQSDYSIADDTLHITPYGKAVNQYQVIQRTGFRRIRSGRIMPLQRKVRRWSATWDEQDQSLHIPRNGAVLLFQPDARTLTMETSIYHKL